MATSTGDVVFRFDNVKNKTADNDSDIWDDTALIKAYDKAINTLKGSSGHVPDDQASDEKSKSKSYKHGKKLKKKKKKKNKWKVGDECQAVFSDDGHLYDAIIKTINFKSSTCWVTYIGYGNEEEHYISDLMEAVDLNSTGPHENDYDSMEYTDDHNAHHPGPTPERPPSAHSHHQYRAANPGWFPPPPHPPHFMPPFPPPPPMWGMTPYQTAPLTPNAMPPGFPFVQMPYSANTAMGLPAMPPPPAPDIDESDETGINSMLMAWYMSGYHTGYYQGLRQGKRLAASNSEPKHSHHKKSKPGATENNLSVASDSNNTEDDMR